MSAIVTKTEARRQRVKRGTKAAATLAAKADARVAIDEIRTISGQPHTDHGANTGEDIQRRAELAESMAAETYAAPDDSTAAAIGAAVADPRYIPLSMLLDDLRRRTKVWTRGFSKTERSDIATDAALILMRWTTQGSEAPIYLGPRGQLPLRRVWFDPDKRTVIRDGKGSRPAPNESANRAMRAAIMQAARKRDGDAESAINARMAELDAVSIDAGTDESRETLAAASLQKQRDTAELAPTLPDANAPDILRDALGVSFDCARSLIAGAYRLTAAQCAESWEVSKSRAENILSAGKRETRKRWPEYRELLEALAAAAPTVREQLATRAYRALAAYRDRTYWQDADSLASAAATAVNEYRAAMGDLPMERRAIEIAARSAGWTPENISPTDHIMRLMTAETRRARRSTSASVSGSHLQMTRTKLDPQSVQHREKIAPTTALPSSTYGRARLYARTAADEKAQACSVSDPAPC